MPNLYNPYSAKPQWGQGISEAIMQFLQMYMMKKMMGGQGQGQQQMPPTAGMAIPGVGAGAIGGQGQPQMGSAANMGQQIDPQMIMQLLQMLGMGGGGIR